MFNMRAFFALLIGLCMLTGQIHDLLPHTHPCSHCSVSHHHKDHANEIFSPDSEFGVQRAIYFDCIACSHNDHPDRLETTTKLLPKPHEALFVALPAKVDVVDFDETQYKENFAYCSPVIFCFILDYSNPRSPPPVLI